MAGKNYFSKPSFRFFTDDVQNPVSSDATLFEFDESDLWNSPEKRTDFKKSVPTSRVSKKPGKKIDNGSRTAASSLPLNIPDWSKILREDYRDSRRGEFDEADEEEERDVDETRIPPHEFLAKQFERTRIASFSVHEGIGRTLKGRDLSRVRNAIWEKTGFEA